MKQMLNIRLKLKPFDQTYKIINVQNARIKMFSVNPLIQIVTRCQAIIWISGGLLLIGDMGTNLSNISIKITKNDTRKWVWKFRLQNGKRCVSASICKNMLLNGLIKVFI